jgi:hypothetical protein
MLLLVAVADASIDVESDTIRAATNVSMVSAAINAATNVSMASVASVIHVVSKTISTFIET